MTMRKKILIVEDDACIREVMEEILESEGFEVSVAINGQEAIDNLRKTEDLPDLILLDLMMPVKDGIAFREEQKEDLRLCGIPVVLMTADGQIEAKKKKMDAMDFLKKPIDIDKFLEAVNRYIKMTA